MRMRGIKCLVERCGSDSLGQSSRIIHIHINPNATNAIIHFQLDSCSLHADIGQHNFHIYYDKVRYLALIVTIFDSYSRGYV
jgi:hypothetical protein